ncbi:chaperonin family protein [Dorcoceras hygrometricum]|uniref:CCT-eta n=1 Tax=Dorcoceras hygrometricum TaxID=472368 RepID=A0A2Z7D5B3_9LAMI|nr:chaperonin family protein [Dorcoceras hygrometricum]
MAAMLQPQIILLKEGTDTSQGKPQLVSNINACMAVADVVRTTLGPRGMDKLIHDEKGNTTISNDGATIMKLLDIIHPAAKILVDIAKSQDSEVGDGTTTVVLLAGEFMKEAKQFIEDGVHPQNLIRSYRTACQLAIEKIKELAVSIEGKSLTEKKSLLAKCAATTLSSKLIGGEKEFFASMVVDSVIAIGNDDRLSMIGIKKVPGGTMRDSFLVNGVAFKKTFSYAGFEQQPKKFLNPKILLLNIELELKSEKENAEIRLSDPSQYQSIVDAEWNIIYNKLDKCVESGAKIVLSRLAIGDLATQYFADRDIFCAGRVTEEDLQRVAAATGGTVQTTVNNIIDEVLGSCEVFEEKQVGMNDLTYLVDAPLFIEEAERSLHDAIMIVRRAMRNSTVVAGGGAIDMEISRYLRQHARTIAGKSQLFINSYAKALEIIPRQLCDNAGFDATDVLNKLRQKHAIPSGEGALYGVDINTGGIADSFANFVWEPAVVKINAINAATEAACLILSVDETVKNPKVRRWRSEDQRRYSDIPPGSAIGVHPEFVSGDSHFHSVQDANRGFRSLNSEYQQSFNSVPQPLQNHAAQQFHGPNLRGGAPTSQQFPCSGPYADQNQPSYRQPRWLARSPFINNQQFKGQEGHQQFRPRTSKPPDYRAWDYAKPGPPPNSGRFTVLSYNILADYLALDHWQLYSHIPRYMLDWGWRKRCIIFELGLWSADVLCFQEVDRFQDLEAELKLRGYSGIWKHFLSLHPNTLFSHVTRKFFPGTVSASMIEKANLLFGFMFRLMRTGNAVDGCASFWRVSRFKLVHEESIEYYKLGLRDNVAQICVLEKPQIDKNCPVLLYSLERSGRVVVCNVHVLFNPKRGDIKLGQIRVLLERAQAVSKLWDNAPIVICGDFNCTPKSPLYNFISEQKLDLTELPRDKVSGQASAEITPSRPSFRDFRAQSAHDSTQVFAANPEKPEQSDFSSDMSNLSYVNDSSGASPEVSHSMYKCPVVGETSRSGISESLTTESVNQLACHVSSSPESEATTPVPAANDNHDNISSYMSTSCESTTTDILLDNKSEKFPVNDLVNGTKDAESCEDINSFLSELHDTGHTPFASDLNSDSHNQKLDSCSDRILNNTLDDNHEAVVDRERYFYVSSAWTPMEIQTATGSADCNVMEHPLKLRSSYAEVQDPSGLRDPSGEPLVTSYHRRFMGTVDYIWISQDLQVSKVLAPIPKHVMLQTPGFPTKKWGSDHIALVSELAFTKDEASSNACK